MITISDGILTIPEGERFVGFSGDNLHTQKKFFIRSSTQSGWLYRLYLTFDDGRHNFFVLPSTITSEGTFLTWNVEESHIFKSGIIKAQIKAFSADKEVYHTTSDVFFAGETSEEDKEFKNSNSEFLHFEETLNELYGKVEKASAKMPYVGTNGNWFTYDVQKGIYVDSGISSLVALGDGTIPPAKLDRSYWEKKINVEQITGAEALLKAIGCSNDGGSIALVNLKIYVASYDTTINGLCYAIGVKFPTGETIYIINLTDGSKWKINRYYEGDGIVHVYRFEYIRLGVPDGTITPLKLDRTYLEKCCTSLGQELKTFEDLYAKIGYISMSGKIGVVKLNVSDSENTTIKDTGYISGEFFAVGSPTHTSGEIYLLNLASGESWTVRHNFDSDTYYAYKVDALTPRVEYIENSAKLTVADAFNSIEEMQRYSFAKNRIYHFKAEAQIGALVGQGYCYARYYEITDPATDVVTDKMLEVFNSSTLKVYALNIFKGTAELITTSASGKSDEDVIPSYWQEHIEGKISAINALQTKGGKDCFSFIVMTDMHYPSNLGKNSPLLAKKILDECSIKYALCLGDLQTRGCHATKELLLAENEAIEEMLSPVRSRLLQTEGNHDGSYGFLDRDKDGEYNNTDASGNLKPEAERETYVNNLTPAELHSEIYRKVGVTGDVHFDEKGSGYYVDDTANKVRYIVLNTQCNDYELQEDGTSLYPKMWLMRFTQSQFDLVIEALNNIPADNWNVVVAGHCPLWQEIGDKDIMTGVLNAYKNKTAYSGEYSGTAKGVAYTNLAKPLSDNTTDTSNWINGYRISSGGISAQSGKTVTNKIYATTGDVVRIKGVDFIANADRAGQWLSDDTFNEAEYVSAMPNAYWSYELENGNTHKFTVLQGGAATTGYVRFTFDTPANPENIIITVNEEIAEAEHGYDYVNVNADFSNAKGNLVAYFAGHVHYDHNAVTGGVPVITTRCDAKEENTAELKAERIAGTVTEQSFDVFTVNKAEGKIYATKIGAGEDRVISY